MAEHNSDENGLEMFKSEVKEQAKVSESTTGSHAEVQRHSFLPTALDRSCFFLRRTMKEIIAQRFEGPAEVTYK